MATTKELLKAQDNGAQIHTEDASGGIGGPVEYSPRYKGDRQPWVQHEGRNWYRYTAARCIAVDPVTEDVPAAVESCDCSPSYAANNHHEVTCTDYKEEAIMTNYK